MNTDSGDFLLLLFLIVAVPLCIMGIVLKYYEFYTERKEHQLIKARKELIWKTL